MRNFKKFLALVLAMLMVSACAVSVSAFDDVAAGDDYAAAVEMLADLGVISGRGDGKFYPEDTLTRQEAAKIAAMLIAGAKGQTMDWNKATCSFADVDAEWAYAYIDYVAQRNVMKGDGEGFKPERKLQIDEAIKIAVAVANSAWAKQAIEDTEDYAPDYWAAYWIDQAETHDLLKDCDIVYYDVPCSRGMFAQIVYNALKTTGNNIASGFGYADITAKVVVGKVDNVEVVTLKDQATENAHRDVVVTKELFESFLTDTTAAELDKTDSLVRFTMFDETVTNKVVKLLTVDVLSEIDTILYSDAKIAYVKENNTFKANLIKIGDYTYTLGVDDGETPSTIIGGTATTVRGIHLYIDGAEQETTVLVENTTIPYYYKALLSDIDNDGDYERCDIITYQIAKAKADGTTKTASKNIVNYKVNGVDLNKDADKEVVWHKDAVLDNTTPMLINITSPNYIEDKYVIDVIEVAKSASGKLTSISPATSSAKGTAIIDGNSYNVVNNVVVSNDTLKQTISYYTLNNEVIEIVAFSDKVIFLDKATVNADGKVVLTGFDGSSFKAVEYILDGQYVGGKYVDVAGHYADVTAENKNYAKDVYLGGKKNNAGLWGESGVKFEDGVYYTVTVTADGTYYKSTENKTLDTTFTNALFTTAGTLTVDGSYVTLGKVPTYINKSVVIITPVEATGDAANNAYSTTYKIETTFAETAGVVAYSDDPTAKSEISYIYVKTPGVVDTTVKGIDADQTIVQILGAYVAADYDYYTYNAFDLIAGKKVTVKCAVTLTDKAYYLAENGMIVDGDLRDSDISATNWVRADAKITRADNGVVQNYKAKYNVFEDLDNDGFAEAFVKGTDKDFSKIMVTIYATKDGAIEFNDDGTAKTIDIDKILDADGESAKFDAYIIEGKFFAINY